MAFIYGVVCVRILRLVKYCQNNYLSTLIYSSVRTIYYMDYFIYCAFALSAMGHIGMPPDKELDVAPAFGDGNFYSVRYSRFRYTSESSIN